MNVLSLCAGVGGLDLGVELATGGDARTVCFVEREAHAAAVLVARMEEALLAPAAVWCDLTTFDGTEWRGVVDLVVAGYPCQPFSTAGKRAGVDDPRHLWPHVARIIRECGAGFVLLENVPGHLSLGFDAVCGDLQGMGYRVAAGVFSAAEVGASHRRERLFIMAHADGGQREQRRGAVKEQGSAERRLPGPDGCDAGVAQSLCGRLGRQAEMGPSIQPRLHEAHPSTEHHGAGERPMDDTYVSGLQGRYESVECCGDESPTWPPGPEMDWTGIPEQCWPATEPDVRGVADGMAARVDRLRACGNGVVPLAAAHAFRTLTAALAGCVEEER